MPRLLDLFGDGLAALRGAALVGAIRASEGRTIMAEVSAGAAPLIPGSSNAELVAAFGADLVCLNLAEPGRAGAAVSGLDGVEPVPDGLGGLGLLLGRPVGINLEPDAGTVPEILRATEANARAVRSAGGAFVVVTANPGRGATVDDVAEATAIVRRGAPELVCLAGKMHLAGAPEALGPDAVSRLVGAGAHGVLVPLPGTVPGMTEGLAADMVAAARAAGALAVGTIGTSQEGADASTMRALALAAKRIGVDVHHIGDSGYSGVARPENVYAYSVAARGVRHTWARMARGVRASWGERSEG